MNRLKEVLKQRVMEAIDLNRETPDEKLYETIDYVLIQYSKNEYISMQEKHRLRRDIFNAIRKLDILQEFIEDPGITEIMINGPGKIFIEKNGILSLSQKCFESKQKLEDMVQQMVKVK